MRCLDNLKIVVKLPLLTILIGVIALTTSEVIATAHSRAAILRAGQERLFAVVEGRASELQRELHSVVVDLDAQSGDAVTLEAVRAFRESWKLEREGGAGLVEAYATRNPYPPDQRNKLLQTADGKSFSLVHRRYHPFFDKHRAARGFADLLIVSPEGRVVYSARKDEDFGADLGRAELRDTPLARAVAAVRGDPQDDTRFSGFWRGRDGSDEALFARAVRSPFGTLEGILVVRYPAARLAGLLNRRSGLGQSGCLALKDAGGAVIAGASRKHDGPVIAASAGFGFDDASFSVIAQQPMSEILVPATALARRIFMDGIVALSVISILGLLVARSMSEPLSRVRLAMARVAHRDYEQDIPDRLRGDEIGSIARQLDRFRASLVEAEGHARESAFKGAAFEATSAALMLVDAQMTIIHVNARLVALVRAHRIAIDRMVADFRPEGLPGRPLSALYAGAEAARRLLTGCDRASDEIRLGQAHIRVEMGAVRDREGEIIGYVLEWTDVTADHLNRVVLGTIDRHLPIASFTPDGRLIQSNALFDTWTLGDRPPVCGGWTDLFGAARGGCAAPDWAEVSTPDRDGATFELTGRSGRPLRVSLNAVRDRAGRLQRHVLVAIQGMAPGVSSGRHASRPIRLAR